MHHVYEKKYGVETIVEVEEVRHETASRVVEVPLLANVDIKINAYVSSVGPIFLEKPYQDLDFSKLKVILFVVLMKNQ
jgi:chorismate synthase